METLVYCLELSKAPGRFYIHFWEVLDVNNSKKQHNFKPLALKACAA